MVQLENCLEIDHGRSCCQTFGPAGSGPGSLRKCPAAALNLQLCQNNHLLAEMAEMAFLHIPFRQLQFLSQVRAESPPVHLRDEELHRLLA